MTRLIANGSSGTKSTRREVHFGTSSLEVIMAFTLLTSVLAFSTPLIVRHQRLVSAQRDYRLALDEASNQLDRLSTLSRDELSAAVERLQPSDFLITRLPSAKIRGEVEEADMGRHVSISVSWGDEQRMSAPVTLAAWFYPESANSTSAAERRPLP